jgi:hypothetical protein
MNTTENLSAQQSLDLISSAIRQAKGNMQQNSFYFLLWGWVIAFCEFGMYYLLEFTDTHRFWLVWAVTIPAWIVTMMYGARQGRRATVRTHYDRINMWLWISFSLSILPLVIFMEKLNYQLNPLIMVMAAVPTFLSGIMIRFRPLQVGGILFYLAAIVCFLVDFKLQYLVGGFAIITGYLIPGYMLRNLRESHV